MMYFPATFDFQSNIIHIDDVFSIFSIFSRLAFFWGCYNYDDGKSGKFSQDWEGKRDDADSGHGLARRAR